MVERSSGEIAVFRPEIARLLTHVEDGGGERIQSRINALSQVAETVRVVNSGQVEISPGVIGEGGCRVQFSESDFAARDMLQRWTEEIISHHFGAESVELREETTDHLRRVTRYGARGIMVEQNPAGCIITLPGTDPSFPALVTGSHIDTIPSEAGPEDGQGGVALPFELFEAIVAQDIKFPRTVKLVFVTGEDSMPFFSGSTMLVRGLKSRDFDCPLIVGGTLRDDLIRWAEHFGIPNFNPDELQQPLLDEKTDPWLAFIEPHAAPTAEQETPVAVAERIMGSKKLQISISPPEQQLSADIAQRIADAPFKTIIALHTDGTGGHAAGSMKNRICAIRKVSYHATCLIQQAREFGVTLALTDLHINGADGPAANKVASMADIAFVAAASDQEAIAQLQNWLDQQRKTYTWPALNFTYAIGQEADSESLEQKKLQDAERYVALLPIAMNIAINADSVGVNTDNTATVGVVALEKGAITLTYDLRSFNPGHAYDSLNDEMKKFLMGLLKITQSKRGEIIFAPYLDTNPSLNIRLDPEVVDFLDKELKINRRFVYGNFFGIGSVKGERIKARNDPSKSTITISHFLSGSEPPAMMSPELIQTFQRATKKLGIQLPKVYVRAGEDPQVYQEYAQYIGMLFARSRVAAHRRDERVDPEDWLALLKVLIGGLGELAF